MRISTGISATLFLVKTGRFPYYVAVGPNDKYVYVTNKGSRTLSILALDGRDIATIKVGRGPSHIAFSPDGKKVYITDAMSKTVSVVDICC